MLIATGVMAYRIKDAADLHDRRAIWRRSAMIVPLALVTAASLWALTRYTTLATFRFTGSAGAGWDCTTYDKGGTEICFKALKK